MTFSTIAFLILGLFFLIGGAELMVRGAARLAVAAGISSLVVGLTVVAFGTSSPELAVSVVSAFKGQADLALGNVVGSNIFNVLVILGLSALVVPLIVAQQLVRFDVPVMIFVSLLIVPLGLDGNIGRIDGLLLFAGVLGYTIFLIRQSRRESSAEVKAEYESEFGAKNPGHWMKNVGLVIVGLVGLVIGSQWLVDSAVTIARAFNVSELVIGLTIVAAGTSMPEVATSVVAAIRGERDIAVGNAVGSNIFNILCVLGLSSIISPSGIAVSPAAMRFDIPVMIAVAIACLPVFFSGYRISRGNGALLLGMYAAYLGYLIMTATNHHFLDNYRSAMIWFVLPILALTLLVIGVQALRTQGLRRPPAGEA
jgi:cation:H+ antiporter